jgi:hypothetical protein
MGAAPEHEENTVILQSHPSDPHDWVLISAQACLLALPAEDAARFEGIADRLSGPEGFRGSLELLIAGGIAGAPSFALIDGDSSISRIVLRGDSSVVVTATDPDAAELTISGVGVSTWSERVLEGASSLRLQLPGSSWTVRLEPAAAPSATASPAAPKTTASKPAAEPAAVTAESALAAPVAEVTLVPKAAIEVPVAVSAPTQLLAPATETDSDGPEPYDFLFGDTIYRTQSGVSIRIPNPDPERPGDHDGRTMLADELGLRGRVPEAAVFPELPAATEASDATVIAPIPGHVSAIAAVDVSAPPQAPPPAAPTLQLERADGRREALARPVLIGRAPSASSTASGVAPRLITILDDKDISRSHLRVAVEGDAVVVTDLASRNGTVVTLPGGSPRKLRASEPTVVLPGTLIDLGGGVTFTVRED